jgi:thiamine biosynthesis lipoprotein
VYQWGDDQRRDGAPGRIRSGRGSWVLGPLQRGGRYEYPGLVDSERRASALRSLVAAPAGPTDDSAEACRQAPPRRSGEDDDRAADHDRACRFFESRAVDDSLGRVVSPAAHGAAGRLGLRRWNALGSTAVLWAPEIRIEAALSAAVREIAAVNDAANRFDLGSELSRINAAGGRRCEISLCALDALRLAIDAAELTGGAVDPTIGQTLRELGYDRDWDLLVHVPADVPLGDGLARGGLTHPSELRGRRWRSIELWEDPPAVRVPPTIRLDLGATAKALAADLGAFAAADAAAGGVLLSLGGDIATSGPAPAGGWPIRVTDDHRDANAGPVQDIVIESGGLATSSLVPRRWYHDGQAVHHIVDPRTGAPVSPYWRTVTVAAADCAQANIAATAAIVLGDQAPAWLATQGLPARLVAANGSVHAHGDWPL